MDEPRAPVVPGAVVATGETGPFRSVSSDLASQIKEEVREASLADESPTLRDALVERSAAEARAATRAPLNPASEGDRIALGSLAKYSADLAECDALVAEADRELEERVDRLALLVPPMDVRARRRLCWTLVLAVLPVLLAMGAVFAFSLDAFVVGPAFSGGRGFAPPRLPLGLSSLEWSLVLGCLIGAGMILKTTVTLHAPRAVGIVVKLAFAGLDLVLSVALVVMRGRGAFSGPGLAFSLIELALSLSVTVAMAVVAKHLSLDAKRREDGVVATQAVAAGRETRASRAARRDEKRTLLQAQIEALSMREGSVVSEARRVALAEATAHAAYVVATSALVAEAAANHGEQLLNGPVTALVATEMERLGLRGGRHVVE